MSTTVLKETKGFPVNVVKCKDGGYAWIVKDLHLVGEADAMEDIQAAVSEDMMDLYKAMINQLDIAPDDV